MEDWILYGRVEDTGTKKAAFRFLRAEHGLFAFLEKEIVLLLGVPG